MPNVVLVPGLMDSDLDGVVGNNTVNLWWGSPVNAIANFGALKLAPDGTTPAPLPTFPQVTAVVPIATKIPGYALFSQMYQAFKALGWNAVVSSYDWRLDIRVSAQTLLNRIAQIIAKTNQPLYVVAHSMGGLVARLAYADAPANVQAMWPTTVFLAVPHGGSYQAVYALSDPIEFARSASDYADRVAFLLARAPGIQIVARGATLLFQAVASTLPSLYQCMPNVLAGSPYPDPVALSLIYTASNWNNYNPFFSPGLMQGALQTHMALNASRSSPKPREVNVVATGALTEDGFATEGAGEPNLTSFTLGQGDDVISIGRQHLAGVQEITLQGATHASVPSDQRVLLDIVSWLLGTDTVSLTFQQAPIAPPTQLMPPPVNATIVGPQPLFPALVTKFDP